MPVESQGEPDPGIGTAALTTLIVATGKGAASGLNSDCSRLGIFVTERAKPQPPGADT